MPEIDWTKLISLEYWLEGVAGNQSITPVLERYSFFFWSFLAVFSFVFMLGVIFKLVTFYLHFENPLKEKFSIISANLIWLSIIGDFWFLFRQFNVGFLGARFWLLVLLLWFLIFAGYLIRYFLVYFKFEYLYFKQKVLHESKN